jgi:hypothetical protein
MKIILYERKVQFTSLNCIDNYTNKNVNVRWYRPIR